MEQSCPVPPWDYDAPLESRRQVDTSAAAIAASGLLQLGYTNYARTILDALCRDHVGGTEGILNHGVYHIHKGLGVNESVMWGDYFFVEALALAEAAK
jgi:unsaturated chondroitin disaccharide hydrolase